MQVLTNPPPPPPPPSLVPPSSDAVGSVAVLSPLLLLLSLSSPDRINTGVVQRWDSGDRISAGPVPAAVGRRCAPSSTQRFQRMNGFLQRLHRASFFSPSSQADIRGGSPGSRPGSVFIYPPGRNGRIGCCFNTFKSQISRQCPMAEKAETAKGGGENGAFRCLLVRRESKNIQSGDSLIINAPHLFVFRLICRLCHFLKNLKYPPAASSVLSGHLLQWSDSVRARRPQAAGTQWAFHE